MEQKTQKIYRADPISLEELNKTNKIQLVTKEQNFSDGRYYNFSRERYKTRQAELKVLEERRKNRKLRLENLELKDTLNALFICGCVTFILITILSTLRANGWI